MTPSKISKEIIAQRTSWIREMVGAIRELPLSNQEEFLQDRRNVAAAESYLRRALEALLDLGRHILAKGFGYPATEYKEIALALKEREILSKEDAALLGRIAGYRNRMVHFYQEVTPDELYEICRIHLHEIEQVLGGLIGWLKNNEEIVDEGI